MISNQDVKPKTQLYEIIDLKEYEYDNPRDILKGLEHFKKTYEFINKDDINPRTNQKTKKKRLMKIRNYRKSNLHQ